MNHLKAEVGQTKSVTLFDRFFPAELGSCRDICSLNNICYQVPSFEILADIFVSLESIRRVFRRVKYIKTSKKA